MHDDVLVAGEQFRVGAQLRQIFAYLVLRLIVEESVSPHRTGGRVPGQSRGSSVLRSGDQ